MTPIEAVRTHSQTDFQQQAADAAPGPPRRSSTLPADSRPGTPRAARTRKYTEPGRIGFRIRCFFSSPRDRLALIERRAQARLETSLENFIIRWSRRSTEEFSPPSGAMLLKAVCKDVLPVIQAGAHIGNASRERANTYEETIGGDTIKPAKPILADIMGACLCDLTEAELSQLYKDLAPAQAPAPSGQSARDLARHLGGTKLEAIAAGILDILEHMVARELATRLATRSATPPLETLRATAEQHAPPLETVRQSLEELQGIGEWLAAPGRPIAEVLNMMLDTLTDDALGKLAMQAWPDRAAQDQYGAEPGAMEAARKFVQACDGNALRLWRAALDTQLRRRNRMVAAQAAETVLPGHEGLRRRINIAAVAPAIRHQIDSAAQILAGTPHNWTALRVGLSNRTLAWMLRLMPRELRIAFLGTLSPHDLSSLRDVLETSADLTQVKPTLGPDIEKVQYDELHKRRRHVEDVLASLHAALAAADRAAATVSLGTLGRAVGYLEAFQGACGIAMPAVLTRSLEEAVARMRALLFGDEAGHSPGNRLRALADLELGELRAARSELAPFGFLVDKSELMSEIAARRILPPAGRAAMDRLFETCADAGAALADIVAALRDAADVLVRHNERQSALGEEASADNNDSLAHQAVREAFERFLRRNGDGRARLRQAMTRHPDLNGSALVNRLMSLALASARVPREETARLNAYLSVLGMAGRVEDSLYVACMGGAMSADDGATPIAARGEGDTADTELDIAIACEFGVAWDDARQYLLPIVTTAHHARFEEHLIAPPDAEGAHPRPVGLHGADGAVAWFSVSQAFARDVLAQPGISLSIEGVSAHGRAVSYPGFDRALEGQARLAALADAMRALQALAGNDAPALTGFVHHGVLDAFATALSWPQAGSPLKLPNGDRILMLDTAPDVAEFRIERQPQGSYYIDTTLAYTAIDRALARNSLTGASEPVSLDPARSRLKATFRLATDGKSTASRLQKAVDIRYRLVPAETT